MIIHVKNINQLITEIQENAYNSQHILKDSQFLLRLNAI